ncbi:MAG: hypothetical protein ABIR96_01620, partial [Bdellovibrionota bacterium]
MLNRFFTGFLVVVALYVAPAWAALTELNAKVRENLVLKSEPSGDAPDNGVEVKTDEKVFVLGSSVDTTFVQVLKKSGESGWVAVDRVDLFRVDRSDYDEYYYALMRQRAFTSRWNLHVGGSYGTLPLGVGVETLVNLNILKRGVFDSKSDQLELGSGFLYHLGADPKPVLKDDGTLFSKPAQPYWEIPI